MSIAKAVKKMFDQKDARIAELEAEVERLRGLVPEAYLEGWTTGYAGAPKLPCGFTSTDRLGDWEKSDAIGQLKAEQEEK